MKARLCKCEMTIKTLDIYNKIIKKTHTDTADVAYVKILYMYISK